MTAPHYCTRLLCSQGRLFHHGITVLVLVMCQGFNRLGIFVAWIDPFPQLLLCIHLALLGVEGFEGWHDLDCLDLGCVCWVIGN
jgi:hypothetical protein